MAQPRPKPTASRKVSAAGLTIMHKPLKAIRLRALLNHEFARKNGQRTGAGGQ